MPEARSLLRRSLAAENDLLRAHSGEETTKADGQSLLNEGVIDPIRISALRDETC
jgi:hypothetical protein